MAPALLAVLLAAARMTPTLESCPQEGPLATACRLQAEPGEDRDLRPEALFFEPSKVLFLPHLLQKEDASETGRQDRLALEVEFNEPIFPFQKRTSARDRHFGGRTSAVAFTPMYRVRIWKEHSSPVRVPSFMPKATYQLKWLESRAPGKQWGERRDPGDPRRGFVGMGSAMLTVGHHSNGQDGCLYADASGAGYPREACPDRPDAVRVNRLNGSFSTNYVQASLFGAYFRVPDAGDAEAVSRARSSLWEDERRASYAWFGGATYEWNIPVDSFGGPIEEAARPIYGMNRFRLTAGFERFPRDGARRQFPRFKLMAWGQITDKKADSADCGQPGRSDSFGQPCAPRFGFGADLHVGLGSAVDYLGAYARYFHGQDYYNLSFTHRKQNRFQAGISFTPGRSRGPAFPRLEKRVTDEEADYERRGCFDQYRRFVRSPPEGTDAPTCP